MLNKIFSAGAGELIKNVGGVIDNLHTSKEEKLEAERKIKDIESSKHQLVVVQQPLLSFSLTGLHLQGQSLSRTNPKGSSESKLHL